MEEFNTVIQEKLTMLPDSPGVYLMKDSSGKIIYVGKAEVLKNRVRSYFQSSKNQGAKVRLMVSRIADFETIVTASELEALILECNLIKKHRPKYNIRLKDDKTYPFIKVTVQEKYPRVFPTRRVIADGARYFGPYANVGAMHETLKLLRRLFPLRTCKTLESRRPCLQYHIGNCPAPCAELISPEEYRKRIDSVMLLLEGRNDKLIKEIKGYMETAATELRFEEAVMWRDRLKALDAVMERQHARLEGQEDRDVIGLARSHEGACIQVFFLRNGQITGRDHFLLDNASEGEDAEVVAAFLKEYYGQGGQIPKGLLLPTELPDQEVIAEWLSEKRGGGKVTLEVPKRGTKVELVEMATRNAKNLLEQAEVRIRTDQTVAETALEDLAQWLELDQLPRRIECYDISHTQGAETVASLVVFTDGVSDKGAYRRYKLKTVEGKPDDFKSMEEVLGRRCRDAKLPHPDLMIIDGGKGQLSSALSVIRQCDFGEVAVVGLAKQFEWVYREGESDPVIIPHHSPSLRLLQRIRDEAHRFAITYHRKLRSKRNLVSVLDHIPGIGPKRRQALWDHFASLSKIKEATVEELAQAPGVDKRSAQAVWTFFQDPHQAGLGKDLKDQNKSRI